MPLDNTTLMQTLRAWLEGPDVDRNARECARGLLCRLEDLQRLEELVNNAA